MQRDLGDDSSGEARADALVPLPRPPTQSVHLPDNPVDREDENGFGEREQQAEDKRRRSIAASGSFSVAYL